MSVTKLIDVLVNGPCIFCGYNGPEFYLIGTHSEECPWRNIQGKADRISAIPRIALEGYAAKKTLMATNGHISKTSTGHCVDAMADHVHGTAIANGWWEEDRNDGEIIALIHSELSEALEALRENKEKSEHIPEFTGLEEELADVIIRVLDYSARKKLRLGDAIVAKNNYNKTRGYKHGGKKF